MKYSVCATIGIKQYRKRESIAKPIISRTDAYVSVTAWLVILREKRYVKAFRSAYTSITPMELKAMEKIKNKGRNKQQKNKIEMHFRKTFP